MADPKLDEMDRRLVNLAQSQFPLGEQPFAALGASLGMDGDEVISRLRSYRGDLRLLAMPDHPTPIRIRTHSPEPVPFLLWGKGFSSNGAKNFTEAAAKKTGLLIADGYKIMGKLVRGS